MDCDHVSARSCPHHLRLADCYSFVIPAVCGFLRSDNLVEKIEDIYYRVHELKEVMAGIEFPFLEIEYVQKLNSHADDFFFSFGMCGSCNPQSMDML